MSPDLPSYGPPSRLSSPDLEWIKRWSSEIWDRHGFPNLKRRASSEELSRAVSLVRAHRLPCILHSGPYGDLSMSVLDHSDFPQVPPDTVAAVHRDHVGLEAGFDKWNASFDWFSRFTHSEENKAVLKFYSLHAPEEKSRYEY